MKHPIFAAALLVAPAAYAADLPVMKAPAAAPVTCAPGSCSGWYSGFGFMGEGTNVDIVGVGLNNSLFSAGGAIKVQGGYQLWSGPLLAAIEGGLGYEFTTANSANLVVAPKFGSKFIGTELIKLGYNFFPSSQSATTAPSQSPLPLLVPANLLAASTPYFTFGGMQRNGKSLWVNGAGIDTVIAAGWSTSVKYLYAPAQQGQNATNVVMFEVNKHFAP
jgi:hypothetical protein